MKRGRPKGYSPYIDITYDELGDWVGRKTIVKVSRAWLEDLTKQPDQSYQPPPPFLGSSKVEEAKIEFQITDLND